jgi:hypothetical protein
VEPIPNQLDASDDPGMIFIHVQDSPCQFYLGLQSFVSDAQTVRLSVLCEALLTRRTQLPKLLPSIACSTSAKRARQGLVLCYLFSVG